MYNSDFCSVLSISDIWLFFNFETQNEIIWICVLYFTLQLELMHSCNKCNSKVNLYNKAVIEIVFFSIYEAKIIIIFLVLRKCSFLSSYWKQKHTFRYLWLYTSICFIWISTIRFMFYFTCIDISKESVLSFELVTNLFCNLNPKNSP